MATIGGAQMPDLDLNSPLDKTTLRRMVPPAGQAPGTPPPSATSRALAIDNRPNFTIPESPAPEALRNPANQQVTKFTPQPKVQTPKFNTAGAADAVAKNDGARRWGYGVARGPVGNALRGAAALGRDVAGAGVVPGVVAGGGYLLSEGATNQLNSLSDENLDMMTNAGGGDDTAFAAAILQQGRATEAARPQPVAPYTPSSAAFDPKARMLRQGASPANTIDVRRNANGNLSFSGKDIGEGADYSGPNAGDVRGKGMVMSMPAAGFMSASPSSDSAVAEARAAAAARGDWDAVNNSLRIQGRDPIAGTGTPQGGAGGGMNSERLLALASSPLGTPGRKAAKMALQQQISNDGSLRVAQMQQDTTLQSKKWDLQVAQAQRNAIAQASKMAGNDPAKISELLSNAGYVDAAKHFSEMANQSLTRETGAQALKVGAGTAADKLFENQAVGVDDKGKGYIDPAKEAVSRSVRNNIAPDFANLPADQQRELMPKLGAAVNVVNGMNTLRNNSFLQSVGWDNESPVMNTLPSLRDAKVGEVGFFKGMVKGGGVSKGDYEVQMPDGTVQYIPRANVGENEIALMKAQGAKFNEK